jgi:hypothetical protein
MLISLTLALAMTGQCAGGVCPPSRMSSPFSSPNVWTIPAAQPAPAPMPVQVAEPSREWLDGWYGDGTPRRVWGWRMADGRVAFNERDQPAKPIEAPKAERPPTANIEPPKPEPKPVTAPVAPVGNFALNGVVQSKLFHDGHDGYTTKGETAKRFVESVQAGKTGIADDSSKPYVSIVGTPEECKPVMDAFRGAGPLGQLRVQVRARDFRPDDDYVRGVGLTTGQGHPEIVVQAADGSVAWHQHTYDGESKLAEAIASSGALRKPNPAHDAAKDPGPGVIGSTPVWVFVVLSAAVVLLLSDRKASRANAQS